MVSRFGPCPSTVETLCSKTRCVSSKCLSRHFPKPLDSRNKRKRSSLTFSTHLTTNTTWDLYPTRSTPILVGRTSARFRTVVRATRSRVRLRFPSRTLGLLRIRCAAAQKSQEFEEISGFNPLERCITIASAYDLFYHTKHMPQGQLASEPISGWHGQGKPYSHAALEWLTYLNHTHGGHIHHACNGGENVILLGGKTFHVDGYDANTHIVYEFHGCFWLACFKCCPNRDKLRHKMNDQTMRDVYEAT